MKKNYLKNGGKPIAGRMLKVNRMTTPIMIGVVSLLSF